MEKRLISSASEAEDRGFKSHLPDTCLKEGEGMSEKGLKDFAQILFVIQKKRIQLIGANNYQDIKLGQLLGKMTEHIKNDFARITLEPSGEIKGAR